VQLIGVDTGGTFTDAVAVTADGRVVVTKALSTPERVEDGVLAALDQLADALQTTVEELLAATDVLAHGTTVGLNAVLTGAGATVGVLTTAGFESTLAIAKASKVHGLSDEDLRRPTRWDKPRQLVPRRMVRGVPGRIDRTGRELEPLDEDAVRTALRSLAGAGVDALAVALLWSPQNPAHEHRLAEIARQELPGCHISLSSELAPRIGEYERTCSVMLDAYVAPLVSAYLGRLEGALVQRKFGGLLLVTRMGGGMQSVDSARQAPIQTLRSGPAGGLAAAQRVGAALGHPNIVATDVGGTSFDVGLVLSGEPAYASRPMIDRFALAMPVVDITSIGTGGGSIAWVDRAMGALRVGPQSAGAEPGPICYGRGGTRPTLTDAAAVVGYVDQLGGTLDLDVDAASRAIERDVATPLGIGVLEAAEGIVQVACEQMKDLVRRTTVERGHDPSDFALYAYGGAGPQYAGRYARDLGVREIIVPAFAAQFSAFGAIASDIRAAAEHDLVPGPLAAAVHTVNAIRARLAESVRAQLDLGRTSVIGRNGSSSVRCHVGLRFYRQVHRVDVPLPDRAIGAADVGQLTAEFRRRYEQVVGPGSANADTPIEAVAVSAEATMPMALPRAAGRAIGAAAPVRHREAHFDGNQLRCPVFAWDELGVDQSVPGPAFVESAGTTVVVYPGQRARADADGHLRLTTGADA
jgi:N-methylhydantoinase A